MRKLIHERVQLTDFCSHGLPIIHDESAHLYHLGDYERRKRLWQMNYGCRYPDMRVYMP